MKIQYQIIDTECLKNDYFSFQWRNENMEKAKMVSARDDQTIHKIYRGLCKINRPMYNYSINYDKTMLNCLMKLVERGVEDLPRALRRINDYIIMGELQYFRLNREFWCDIFQPMKKKYNYEFEECFENSKDELKSRHGNEYVHWFVDEFPMLLGQSQEFKQLNMIDIPKMLFYYSIRKDGIIRPSISLKNIQLIKENYNITHDFDNCFDIEEIIKKGGLEQFEKYSLNDVDFLFRYFQESCLPIIESRINACEAIKRFNPEFTYTSDMIHSESNSKLLVNAFGIENEEIENIPYCEYIKPTGIDKFDEFIKFVDEHKEIQRDVEIKELYCEKFNLKYNPDDEKRVVEEGKIETKIKKFDVIDLYGTECVIGFGGIHGAINNYYGENLFHYDVESQYPALVRKLRKYFKKFLNLDLYDALYAFKNTDGKPLQLKVEKSIETLELREKEIYKLIDDNGNDIGDIADNEPELESIDKTLQRLHNELKIIKRDIKGAKLLLNTSYGIINSVFNLSIAHKTNGRFIPLMGQYVLITMAQIIKKHIPDVKFINVNTDGVIVNKSTTEQCELIIKEFNETLDLKLDVDIVDKLIQNDVNNYIKIVKGDMTTKGGAFANNQNIKHAMCRFEKLPANVTNALKIIDGDRTKIEVLPILFHQKSKVKSTICLENEETSKNKVYYLTNKENGNMAIKHVAKPLILSWGGEIMYFTTDKDNADVRQYIKFADITYTKIMNFELTKKDEMKYYSYKLTPEPETNKTIISKRTKIKKELTNIFKKGVCMTGYKGSHKNVLCIDNKPIQDLSNYTMTQIKASTEVLGFSIENNDNITALYTKDEKLIKKYQTYKTFEVVHKSGIHCFIFNENIDVEDGMKIITTDYIPVYTFNGDYKYIVY